MEDFHDAGGLPALLERIRHLLAIDCPTVNGRTLGENIAGAEVIDDRVILPLEKPLASAGGTCVLRGSLAPDGCVLKLAGQDRNHHRGPARVFDSEEATYAAVKAKQVRPGDVVADSKPE